MFDAELNEPQAEAVAHVQGPLLVFAGAGSGKTRVITYRVANLVACARVPPYRILAVTFTNKAAGEMRSRLGALLGDDFAKDLWVGTFHATCAKLLRVHGAAVGIDRNFVIYDSSDQKAVVTRVLRELNYDEKRYPPRAVLGRIHKEKQEGRGPEEMSVDSYMDEAVHKIYVGYEAHLRAANAVDFEDLILQMGRILSRPELAYEGDKIRRRFEYVLVDEFQDTNATQYGLVRDLVRDHKNLCVVGDDDQSIYRWRGADVRNIRGFRHDFPGARVVKLEQNYRSSARIVRAALGVIGSSREREPKELWTSNEDGHPVEIMATRDERDEAAHVVRVVREAQGRGVDPRQIAVFYRIHAQSRVLEEALRAVNIPYQIIGGVKFYERAEVKDALAYLRVLSNPKSDVDLLRIINTPARGIGSTTVDRLVAFATLHERPVIESLRDLDAVGDLGSAPKKKLAGFRALLDELTTDAEKLAPSALLERVLEKTGYKRLLEAENNAEADARLENLRELYGSILDYEVESEAAGEKASLQGFLERVTLQSDVDTIDPEGAPSRRITLMTVHGAKGLEFDTVVLTGMEEEMFPYRGMEPGHDEELEEERRLAYVAITRARQRLVVTHTEMRQIFGTTRWGRPSRFLDDIPGDVAKHASTQGVSRQRFVDRAPTFSTPSTPWRHPQEVQPAPRNVPERAPGERYVDSSFFVDESPDELPIRRGSRVVHTRFGEGEVRRVEHAGEPAVVAFFPGWGEKKILARFLKLA